MWRRILIVFIFAAVLLVAPAPYDAQSQDATVPPPLPFSALTLELASLEQNVFSLQAIPILVRLKNTNARPALGYLGVGFGECPLFLTVKKPSSSERSQISMLRPLLTMTKYTHVLVEPGETVEARELITLGLTRYFSEPGNYEIRAKMSNPSGTEFIESNPLTINVQEPTVLIRTAHSLFRDSPYRDYLFSGADFQETKTTLERLALLHPTTPYGRDASFILGEVYFYQKDYSRALLNLIRLENLENFVFRHKVRKYLSEIRSINPAVISEKPN